MPVAFWAMIILMMIIFYLCPLRVMMNIWRNR